MYSCHSLHIESPFVFVFFFSSPKRPVWLCHPSRILFNTYRHSFQRVKRPGRDVGYYLHLATKLKVSGASHVFPLICLHGVDRYDFTFLPTCVLAFTVLYEFVVATRTKFEETSNYFLLLLSIALILTIKGELLLKVFIFRV
jgi:hypothetical protein